MAVHVTATNARDSSQAGTVIAQAKDRYPSLESFTADQGFRRQAYALDCKIYVTVKPKKRASP